MPGPGVLRFPKVLGSEHLSAADKLVWFYLADRQGDAEVCWPSVSRIADETKLGLATVKRAIRRLTAYGWVEKVEGYGKRDRRGRTQNGLAFRVVGLDQPARRPRRPAPRRGLKMSPPTSQQPLEFAPQSEDASSSYPDRSVPAALEATSGSGGNGAKSGGNGATPTGGVGKPTGAQNEPTEQRRGVILTATGGQNEPPSFNQFMLTTQTDSARAREGSADFESTEGGEGGDDPLGLGAQERTAYLALLTGYAERYEQRRAAPAGDQRGHMVRLAQMFVAPMAAREDREAEAVASDLLDGVFADDWLAARDWPLGAVVTQPGRYYRPPASAADCEQAFERKIRALRAERERALAAQDVAKAEEAEHAIRQLRRSRPAGASDGGNGRR